MRSQLSPRSHPKTKGLPGTRRGAPFLLYVQSGQAAADGVRPLERSAAASADAAASAAGESATVAVA